MSCNRLISIRECVTCLKPTETHRRRVRAVNLLDRRIQGARRRTKVGGTIPGDAAGLSLIHAALVDVSRRRRRIHITPGRLEDLNDLRPEVVPLAESVRRMNRNGQGIVFRDNLRRYPVRHGVPVQCAARAPDDVGTGSTRGAVLSDIFGVGRHA